MSGAGLLAIVVIIVCVLLIVYYSSARRRDTRSTKLDKPPALPPARKKAIAAKSRPRVPDTAYPSGGIRRTLSRGYRESRAITIEYETTNPMPGQPAINIRDVEIYGLGKEYFDAFCHLRNDMRIFKISRVRWAQLATSTYEVPIEYTPTTWVEFGWGVVQDKRLEDVEAVPQETGDAAVSRAPSEKWVWPRIPDHQQEQAPSATSLDKPRASRRKVLPSERGEGRAKSYVRHDWQKRFEDSIISPFPEELSPALPYLREAHQLDKEEADQAKIDQLLQKAQEADPQATSYYILRQSIIKKRKGRRVQHRPSQPLE